MSTLGPSRGRSRPTRQRTGRNPGHFSPILPQPLAVNLALPARHDSCSLNWGRDEFQFLPFPGLRDVARTEIYPDPNFHWRALEWHSESERFRTCSRIGPGFGLRRRSSRNAPAGAAAGARRHPPPAQNARRAFADSRLSALTSGIRLHGLPDPHRESIRFRQHRRLVQRPHLPIPHEDLPVHNGRFHVITSARVDEM